MTGDRSRKSSPLAAHRTSLAELATCAISAAFLQLSGIGLPWVPPALSLPLLVMAGVLLALSPLDAAPSGDDIPEPPPDHQ